MSESRRLDRIRRRGPYCLNRKFPAHGVVTAGWVEVGATVVVVGATVAVVGATVVVGAAVAVDVGDAIVVGGDVDATTPSSSADATSAVSTPTKRTKVDVTTGNRLPNWMSAWWI